MSMFRTTGAGCSRALQVTTVVLAAFTTWVGLLPSHSQAQSALHRVGDCALPPRYMFDTLADDLHRAGIPYSPAAVAQAHARYTDAIDAALPACLPFVVQAALGDDRHSSGDAMRLSDSELVRIQAHQERMAAAAERAENALFDELASSPLLASDQLLAAFEALRARRSLDRAINVVQRRCAVQGMSFVPSDASSALIHAGSLRNLAPDTRARIAEVMDARSSVRLQAWQAAVPAIDAAVAESLALQREAPSAPTAAVSHRTMQVQARLLKVEFDMLLAISRAVPEVSVRMHLLAHSMRPSYLPTDLGRPGTMLDFAGGPYDDTVVARAHAIACMPQWDDATRAKLRPVLVAWVKEDADLLVRHLNECISTLHDSDEIASWAQLLAHSEAREQLAHTKVAELRAIANVDWLVAGGIIPFDAATQLPPHADDARDFGVTLRLPKIEDHLPHLPETRSAQRSRATQGMTPAPWHEAERRELFDALRLSDAQQLVAASILDDAAEAWDASVESHAQILRALRERDHTIPWQDHAARAAHLREVEAAFKTRRDAWAAARAQDDQTFESLANALGGMHETARDMLLALRLKRMRDIPTESCSALQIAMRKVHVPDVVTAAIEFRGTDDERATVLHAVALQASDFLASRSAELEGVLRIQEQDERTEREIAEHLQAAISAQQVTAAHEAIRADREAVNNAANAHITRTRRLDNELLGRVEAALPEPLAARLHRSIRIEHATDRLGMHAEYWKVLLYAIEHGYPSGLPVVHATLSSSLDTWAAWAEPIVREVDRQLPPELSSATDDSTSVAARRNTVLDGVLRLPLMDRIEHACAQIAEALPPDISRRTYQLRQYCPPPPVTTAPTPAQ